jgi:hypothetical protein
LRSGQHAGVSLPDAVAMGEVYRFRDARVGQSACWQDANASLAKEIAYSCRGDVYPENALPGFPRQEFAWNPKTQLPLTRRGHPARRGQ